VKNKLYFVSFGDTKKPKGQQARGACLIEAATPRHAVAVGLDLPDVSPAWIAYPYEVERGAVEDRELPREKLIVPEKLRELGYTV
jgi:hypothetical protein